MGTGDAAGRAWGREAGWLGLTLLALLAALCVEHWVVHRGVILPSLTITGQVLPWMWGALFGPELMVAFVAGWRLRLIGLAAVYAPAATLLRHGFELALARAGEPGHVVPAASASEFVLFPPLVALAYFAIFAFAAVSGREDARLEGVGRDGDVNR